MFGFMVNAEGGLTTAGYVVCVIVGLAVLALASYFAGKSSGKKKMGTKQLVFCAMAIALAFLTSYIRIFRLPWGGSVTLCNVIYCTGSKLVWCKDGNAGWTCLWYSSVYTGAVRAVLFPGMLRLYPCFCGIGSCRLFCEEQGRADKRICCGSACKRGVSCLGRIPVLDVLYAG